MAEAQVVQLEAWLTKKQLCELLGCTARFIDYRCAEGLPHALIAGRLKFRQSEVEQWLQDHGHMERRGAA